MITFDEFIRYLIKRSKKSQEMEPHFERFHKICKMCLINYDFFGKFDTLADDVSYLLRKIFPNVEDHFFVNISHPRSALGLLASYYANISSDLIYQLEESYKDDFNLFGYNFHSLSDI